MLPRRLYEVLPYLYIITGIVSALIIHSRLIIISSLLMCLAGVLILSMRRSSRRFPVHHRRVRFDSGHIGAYSQSYIKRSTHNRRQSSAAQFPLIDTAGQSVEVDRRQRERRLSAA